MAATRVTVVLHAATRGSAEKSDERDSERWCWRTSAGGGATVRGSSRKIVERDPERSKERRVNGAPPAAAWRGVARPVASRSARPSRRSWRRTPSPAATVGGISTARTAVTAMVAAATAMGAATAAAPAASGDGGGGRTATASASWDDGGRSVAVSSRAVAAQKHRVAAVRAWRWQGGGLGG